MMNKIETPKKDLNNDRCVSCNELTPYTNLFTRIGNCDNLFRGQSISNDIIIHTILII